MEKRLTTGKINQRPIVAGIVNNPGAVAKRRSMTPEFTKPGYLWMNVMVGFDLASSSRARVV